MEREKNCLILDGMSSASFLAPEFVARGYKCYHIFSTGKLDVNRDLLQKGNFVECRDYDDDYGKLLSWARSLNPSAIIAGMDPGVPLCDRLNHDLGLVGNDPGTSLARRNKYYMNEALRSAGLFATPQFKSSKKNEIVAWAQNHGHYPVVLKGLTGASSSHVVRCMNENELVAAFDWLMGQYDFNGGYIDELVVQGFVDGMEYMFNTVSLNGKHHLTDIWRLPKYQLDGKFIPLGRDLLPFEGTEQDLLREYGFKVLDAVGLRNGACHLELKLSSAGPCLIEVNPRLSGPKVITRQVASAANRDPIKVLVDTYTNPDSFERYCGSPYILSRASATIVLSAKAEGYMLSKDYLERIRSLPSVSNIELKVPAGEMLPKAKSINTLAARIDLVAENLNDLNRDREQILEWDRSGLLILLAPSKS